MSTSTASQPQAGPSAIVPHRGRVVGRLGYVALGLGIALLLGIVATSIWLAAANRGALDAVASGRALLATVRRVGEAIDEAEAGQRGFLLTAKEAYLKPFDAATKDLPALLTTLEEHAAGGSTAPGALRELRLVIADKLDEMSQTVGLARRGDREAALALVQTDRGEKDIEAIRLMTANMERAQQANIDRQFAAINQRGGALVLIDTAGLAGLIVLAAIIAYGIRSHFAQLRSAQDGLEAANRELESSNVTLERTVRVRTADLVEANDEIQRFAYIVSHDLRAPLVNIMGFTSELDTAAGALAAFVDEVRGRGGIAVPPDVTAAANDDIPEAIRFIKSSTAKMDRLIGAILRLSREGRRVLTSESLDMREVLNGIAESLQHQATGRNAEIAVGAMPTLMGDRVATEQIFGNLLDNALKYLKPGRPGVIRVDGRVEGRMAAFEVRDNGRGIAPKDHERVFELFRRAGDQTVPGEGIGLAHVRALVRRLGGTITCESALDEGTVFRVRLPVTMPSSRSAAA